MQKSSIQRERSGYFALYLFGRFAGQFNSVFDATEAARASGEKRPFKGIDATSHETAEQARVVAIEDNGGGLHLAVVEGDTCTHFFSGFEHGGDRAPTMQEEIESAATEGVRDWDGDAHDPQASYNYFLSSEYGYKVIGEWTDGEVVVYTEAMGNSGHRWSRTSYDD